MLGDEQDTIEREAATTEGQSLGNRRVNLYPREAPDSLMAQVAGSDLVDVQGDEIHRRLVMAAVPAIAVQKPVNDVLCVRPLPVLSDHGSDLGTPASLTLRCERRSSGK